MRVKTKVKMACPNNGWTISGYYAGETVPKGTEFDVPDKIGEDLIARGFVARMSSRVAKKAD